MIMMNLKILMMKVINNIFQKQKNKFNNKINKYKMNKIKNI